MKKATKTEIGTIIISELAKAIVNTVHEEKCDKLMKQEVVGYTANECRRLQKHAKIINAGIDVIGTIITSIAYLRDESTK